MGTELQGRRLPDAADGSIPALAPGEYIKVRNISGYGGQAPGSWMWFGAAPNGDVCNLVRHTVTEHDDGTITVEPSIRVFWPGPTPREWHGYLKAGVWEEC